MRGGSWRAPFYVVYLAKSMCLYFSKRIFASLSLIKNGEDFTAAFLRLFLSTSPKPPQLLCVLLSAGFRAAPEPLSRSRERPRARAGTVCGDKPGLCWPSLLKYDAGALVFFCRFRNYPSTHSSTFPSGRPAPK